MFTKIQKKIRQKIAKQKTENIIEQLDNHILKDIGINPDYYRYLRINKR